MSLSTRYNPKETEAKWYAHWEAHNYFHSEPDDCEPFTILIPPPNVTGKLHMGHMLNNTIQDVLIRRARMQGKNACWVPGTDHASIATEAKVVQMLRKKGIKKGDISREEFLKYAWEWKEEYGGIILDQLKKLGASCDWQRTRFTMEPSLSDAVVHVFVDLFKKGKLYRGLRMTNWDPEAKTVLSNEEVIHQTENSQLFHIRYPFQDNPGDGITIATQRPETIMADVAIAVHPDEPKYRHLVGKMVLIPLINKPIPIIADSYVDREFGTGALKITPAHDQNDLDVGKRHNLPVIDILTEDGKLNEHAQILVGEDRFVARKKIRKLLEDSGALIKLEDYSTSIGRSERTNAVVEPRLTNQWFLDMKDFAKTALQAVKSGEVKFYPENMWNMYYQWLQEDNVRDWCISRQLWWGQRIPAWYLKTAAGGRWTVDGEEAVFVAENVAGALAQAKARTGNNSLTINDLEQDEDVVDTWFSSWLWPISVFDGFKTKEELKYYYPTSVLVTGWDIMFFWVARMIMAGYEWSEELLGTDLKGKMPFHDVYFTGMVRDNKRRKMSKSLGNSPEALELIENYGADGVRFGMLLSGSAGNDIIFDAPFDPATKEVLNESKLCEQGRNFCNKMWNALRLIKGWETDGSEQSEVNALAVKWINHKFDHTLASVASNFDQYRLGDVLMGLYQVIWDDFCSWYLEIIKPNYTGDGVSEPLDRKTYEATITIFEKMMSALHPFMPFVTEEIWHQLRHRHEGNDCIVTAYPSAGRVDKALIQNVEKAKDAITKIRDARSSKGVSPKEPLKLHVQDTPSARELYAMTGLSGLVQKIGNISELTLMDNEPAGTVAFISGTEKYFLQMDITIDMEAERARLMKDLEYYRGFAGSVEKKLDNERFVSGAPLQVVESERKKLADATEKIRILEEALRKL
ncbi:MAG: valine--tRNA ligase [Lewinellaceae bacterium]|nr:valine--tRNA ligase [Saprospiraceae bacterium]MCB9340606.1 valine--tRNA ligase [Lewinellaceae bacterium]